MAESNEPKPSGFVAWWTRHSATDALTEFAFVFILSNLPFCALVFFHYMDTPGSQFSVSSAAQVIRDNWKPGEILIFVSALLAPVSFLMTKFHRARQHMPLYLPISLILLAMYLGSSWIFAYDRLGANKNPEFTRDLAFYLYILATILWYFSLVFQRKLENPVLNTGGDAADKIAAQLGQGN